MFKLQNVKKLLIGDKVSPRQVENISPNLEVELSKLEANQKQYVRPKKYAKFGFRM